MEDQKNKQEEACVVDRFGRTDEQRQRPAERLFDEICQIKMNDLVELTSLLTGRLSLKICGGFVSALERVEAKPVQEKKAWVVTVRGQGSMSRVEAIRAAKEILGLGLRESRDWVEGLPRAFDPEETEAEAKSKAERWISSGFEVEVA